jgi:hypothetical protein
MGCDIHTVLERKINGKWVAVAIEESASRDRNYDRFAMLAGVRGEGPEPRGMPEDASDSAAALAADWGGDGHSHSWLPIEEACDIYLESERDPSEIVTKYAMESFFNLSPESTDEHRLVFWFDN